MTGHVCMPDWLRVAIATKRRYHCAILGSLPQLSVKVKLPFVSINWCTINSKFLTLSLVLLSLDWVHLHVFMHVIYFMLTHFLTCHHHTASNTFILTENCLKRTLFPVHGHIFVENDANTTLVGTRLRKLQAFSVMIFHKLLFNLGITIFALDFTALTFPIVIHVMVQILSLLNFPTFVITLYIFKMVSINPAFLRCSVISFNPPATHNPFLC